MPDTESSSMAPEGLTLEVGPEQRHREDMAQATRAILRQPTLRQHFPSGDLWLVGFDVDDKEDEDGPRFTSVVYDTVSGRSARVDGWLDDPESPDITPIPVQRPPGDDEYTWAVSVLAEDRDGAALLTDETTTYRPMPPLADGERPDGAVERVITVGLRTGGSPPKHRVVGVRTGDGEIFWDPAGVPAPSTDDCGPLPAPSCPAAAGESLARVRVLRGELVLWELTVVRPQASSGTNGSGVELRNVDYRGQRVLARGHVPILNVQYGSEGAMARCGPTYRDWQNEEACFTADGSDPVPGFRVCSAPPETILESGADGGDFRGVALWLDGEELLIVSQLQAGWYRYVSEWRLHADGTIRPRFGFAAVANPCTCKAHHHHAYWRFDFDILDAATNLVQEYNDPPVLGTSSWHTVRYEVRRNRSAEHGRYWRVRNVRASQGYVIRPGADDGTADDYGAGDVWILRHHPDEVDDGQGFSTDPARTRAQLDRFVSGESVERQDVVVWYAGHFLHHEEESADVGRRVGPDLVPYQWKDRPQVAAAYAPLEPPSGEELRPPSPPA